MATSTRRTSFSSIGLSAAVGSLVGLSGSLPEAGWHPEGAQLASSYALVVVGAFCGVGCRALWTSVAPAGDARLGARLLSATLALGLASFGLGGWLRWLELQTGSSSGMGAMFSSLGAGVFVSCGGLVGIWVALRHLAAATEPVPLEGPAT